MIIVIPRPIVDDQFITGLGTIHQTKKPNFFLSKLKRLVSATQTLVSFVTYTLIDELRLYNLGYLNYYLNLSMRDYLYYFKVVKHVITLNFLM